MPRCLRRGALFLENDVSDHSVLSRFRTRLTAPRAWDVCWNRSIGKYNAHSIIITKGCHVDASITQSPRKPKTKSSYEAVTDREDRGDEGETKAAMRVIEVIQPGVDAEVRWVASDGKSDSIFRWAQSSSYVPQHLMIELSG